MILPHQVLYAMQQIENEGFEAFAVGGCVRDSLMGKSPSDWDLATSALPEDILNIFRHHSVLPTGLKHGTVTVILEHMPLEITTYRIDGNYVDNRHPSNVLFSQNIADDLKRRDFTINAMAYSPRIGLIDLYGGTDDLGCGIIRAVGDPKTRFGEDALRIIRAIRFSAVLGFDIEKNTLDALFHCKSLLKNIASERICTEFNKILLSENSASYLSEFFPVLANRLFAQDLPDNIPRQQIYSAFEPLSRCSRELCVRLGLFILGASCLYNISPSVLGAEFLSALKYDNHTRKFVTVCIENPDIPLINDRIFLRKCLNSMGNTAFEYLLQIKSALSSSPDGISLIRSCFDTIIKEGDCISLQQLDICGDDLISSFGLEGRQIGNALDLLLNAVIEGKCENKRDALLKFFKKASQL